MDKLFFSGGMNSDDDVKVLPQGDYRSAVNCRIGVTEDGNNFSVTNTKGNTLVSYTLPAGSSKTIGAYRDLLTSTIVYFNCNDRGNHHILQYSWVTNSIAKIIQDVSLNFDVNHKITGINLINGLLYWTDNYNEPRKLNITKALSGGYAPYSNDYAYAIKQPPLFPPTVGYVTDTSKKINYLNGFLFQFKYRYVYDDYEKSAFSPISTVPLPLLDASSFTDSLKSNRIDININTGNAIVTKIEIAARIGNSGDFFSIVTLDKSDPFNVLPNNSVPSTYNYTFLFYNSSTYNNVDLKESIKLFDNVPRKAKGQDFIDPTRLTYGGIVEGFDPVDVVAKLDLTVLPPAPTNTYNIHCAKVLIKSPFSTSVDTVTNELICQPIWTLQANGNITPCFGGFAPNSTNTGWVTIDNSKVYTDYDQQIPLEGFAFYLAGTDFYGVSKQQNKAGLTTTVGGAYIVSPIGGSGNPNSLQQGIIDAIGSAIYKQQVYSDVLISNVPEGKYILRIADHRTTQTDINTGTRAYQKRSTCAVQIAGVEYYEVEIIITAGNITVNGAPATLTGNTIELPPSIILDMTDSTGTTINTTTGVSTSAKYTNVIEGYVLDHDATTFPSPSSSSLPALYASDETRIDLAQVALEYNAARNIPAMANAIVNNWQAPSPLTYTDHNGYFFAGASFSNSVTTTGLVEISPTRWITVGSQNSLPLGWGIYPYPNYNLNILSGALSRTLFARSPSAGYFDNSRTTINGRFTDAGGGVKGVSVVISRGGWATTNVNGIVSVTVYADTLVGAQRQGDIFYKLITSNFFETFSRPSDNFSIAIKATTTPQPSGLTTPYSLTTGYNYTFPLTITPLTLSAIGKTATSSNEKRAGEYQYGLVYYDHGNRSGLTNTNDYGAATTTFSGKFSTYGLKLYVPYYTETNPSTSSIYGGGEVKIDWSIYHVPPAWATHYQWVRTKNSANNRFLQFIAKAIVYVDDNNAPSTFTAGTKIRIDITNIGDYDKKYPSSTLVYAEIKKPAEDRIRFIRDNNGNFFNGFVDLQVLGTDPGKYIYVENRPGTPDITGMNGLLFEVYNPKLELAANEQLFWEIGECFDIGVNTNGVLYHKGPNGDQNTISGGTINNIPVTTIPATGTFIGGDTYYRLRDMVFTTGSKTYFIEDASVSDFYQSQVSDIGRPNRFDPDYREVERPSTIYYSELFIPETKINNLNSFYDTNFETYEQKYGSIQKLYNENHRLIVFQELKVGQVPVNQNIVYDNTGAGQIYSVAKVLNDIIYYAGEYGMTNPEGFAVYGGAKYWPDSNRLVPLRLTNAGIDPISENESKQIKMHTFFTQKFSLYQKTPNAFIYGVYDQEFKNYVLAFEKLEIPGITTIGGSISGPGFSISGSSISTSIPIAPGETLVFDEPANRWRSDFEYLPDFMCPMNEGFVSFKDGALYVHNTNATANNFYGVQYTSQVTTASRQNPSEVKVLLAISEETPDAWSALITNESGQSTNVYASDFELREGLLYSDVYRNENTPNVTDPGINGDEMRDTSFLIKLTNTLTRFTKLFAINILYADSPRSNK